MIKKRLKRKNPELIKLPTPDDFEIINVTDFPYYEIQYIVGNDIISRIRFKSKSKALSYFGYILSYFTGLGKIELVAVVLDTMIIESEPLGLDANNHQNFDDENLKAKTKSKFYSSHEYFKKRRNA